MLILAILVLFVLFAAAVGALLVRGQSRAASEKEEPHSPGPTDLALGLIAGFVLLVLFWLAFFPPFGH